MGSLPALASARGRGERVGRRGQRRRHRLRLRHFVAQLGRGSATAIEPCGMRELARLRVRGGGCARRVRWVSRSARGPPEVLSVLSTKGRLGMGVH